jgi:hypothetical protein
LDNIYPLKDGFGLLKERGDGSYFISLIFLDLHHQTLKKLHTVEYLSYYMNIFVNKADSTTFILNDELPTQICKIIDKTIVIGDLIEIDFYPQAFYGGNIYSLKLYDRDGRRLDVRIYMYS